MTVFEQRLYKNESAQKQNQKMKISRSFLFFLSVIKAVPVQK